MVRIYETMDVYGHGLEELDMSPRGKEWYDFIGGTKNIR